MVAPSFDIMISPFLVLIILSIPLGPKDVRIASDTALAARMLALRTSCGFSLSLKVALEGATAGLATDAITSRVI